MYELERESFATPHGNYVQLNVRTGTNDHNTVNSCLNEDEYGLRRLTLSGKALDVGAHIGSVAIALAVDFPDLEIIALEAVPPNCELIRLNLALNGLSQRVTVLKGAACKPRQKLQKVAYGYRGSVLAEHHAFIGNATLVSASVDHDVASVLCHSLAEFVPLDFLKIDCEGGEWAFLRGPALAQVARIHGEWHPTEGHVQADMLAVLSPTHDVTFSGPIEGPGGFVAVRK